MEFIISLFVILFCIWFALLIGSWMIAGIYFAYTGIEDGMTWLCHRIFDGIAWVFKAAFRGIRKLLTIRRPA